MDRASHLPERDLDYEARLYCSLENTGVLEVLDVVAREPNDPLLAYRALGVFYERTLGSDIKADPDAMDTAARPLSLVSMIMIYGLFSPESQLTPLQKEAMVYGAKRLELLSNPNLAKQVDGALSICYEQSVKAAQQENDVQYLEVLQQTATMYVEKFPTASPIRSWKDIAKRIGNGLLNAFANGQNHTVPPW